MTGYLQALCQPRVSNMCSKLDLSFFLQRKVLLTRVPEIERTKTKQNLQVENFPIRCCLTIELLYIFLYIIIMMNYSFSLKLKKKINSSTYALEGELKICIVIYAVQISSVLLIFVAIS